MSNRMAPIKQTKISIDTFEHDAWLRFVSDIHRRYDRQQPAENISFDFAPCLSKDAMAPWHVVTYACLIHFLIHKGHIVRQSRTNEEIFDYIFNVLNFAAYWKGGKNHVEAGSSNRIFNLWRIVEQEKDLYAKQVEEYFKRYYFEDKDLSAVSISLVEAFYNVFDHAEAGGNAFSIIFYNEESQTLSYAVADFGIGIPTSVKRFNRACGDDIEALEWAVKDCSTVRSTSRNKGFGMSNILSAAERATIISNNGLLVKQGDIFAGYPTDGYAFPGTMIYLDINMSDLEDEEVLDVFTL
ncbi:MAG: ATP-binding protein [Muribaculaceae bacterium]|nr:ATP-binding protein [Muribaculaceae bacterium]